MKYLDLFSGIGGFALGAYWAGARFDAHYFSEIDPWASELYQKRFPDAVALGDIRGIDGLPRGEWVITGGFPCQPFSTAARGRNNATDLWPEMARVCNLVGATVIAENVSFEAIAQARADIGGQIFNIGAAALGAPHNRPRWWLLANTNRDRQRGFAEYAEVASISGISRLDWWQNPADPMGMDDGLPGKMDRLRGLGNAIVPQIAELIFRQLI